MNIYEIFGYSSGFLFAFSLIPQVYKSYKTKQLRDFSIIYQIVFLSGMILMLIYSIHDDLKPIYIPASCEAFLMFKLFCMKLYYRKNESINDKDIENP